MRRIISISLICQLLTACTIGIVRQDQIPKDAPLSPTPDIAATEDVIVMTRVAATVSVLQVTPPGTSTPTPLPPRTVTPPSTPIPSGPTVPLPSILSFKAYPTEIGPDEPVTLTWATTNTVRASLRRTTALVAGSFEQEVTPSGNQVVSSQGAGRHWHDYELTAYNSAGMTVTRSLIVRFHCPDSLFFTSTLSWCPTGPAQSSWAAEQVFEGGRMLWLQDGSLVSENYKGQPLIFVLYTNGNSWEVYTDTWTSTEPDSDPTLAPPEGLIQPIRGFGKVWRNSPKVQNQLHWALAAEQGFETFYQRVAEFDWDNQCHYLRSSDGRVISLCSRGGVWSFVTP
jgi:hypothetical protein